MPRKGAFENLVGRKFGHLTVIKLLGKKFFGGAKYGKLMWECRCNCGKVTRNTKSTLVSGRVISCGCQRGILSGKIAKERLTKHGAKGTPEWVAWLEMRRRCNSPESREAHKNYVKKQITVCKRWAEFSNFLADMEKKPSSKHSLDRIKNDGNYEPDNCRWATRTEQNRNRSNTRKLTVNGVTKLVIDWAEEKGLSYWTLLRRSKKNPNDPDIFRK